MKKNLCCAALCLSLCLAVPLTADAQNFLNKLKDKAKSAIGTVVQSGFLGDVEAEEAQSEMPESRPTATDRIPKLKQSNVVWYGEVTPSTASDARALLNELPALPTPSQVANPSDEHRLDYEASLTAIALRVSELDALTACSDDEMLAMRENIYKELEGTMGITTEEMKALEDENLPQAERERIQEKMTQHLLGDIDLDEVGTMEERQEAAMKKYEGRVKEIETEMEAIQAKAEAGTATEADAERAQELSDEMDGITKEMMGFGGGLGSLLEKTKEVQNNKVLVSMAKWEQDLMAYSTELTSIEMEGADYEGACAKIAREYYKELKAIYEKVWQMPDAQVVSSLYDQADDMIMNYRTRAASVYLAGLNTKLDKMKAMLPKAEKLYSDMAQNEFIPACAAGRAPLNVVTSCVNILEEAYADFPQPDVNVCQMTLITEKDLGLTTGSICPTESGLGSFGQQAIDLSIRQNKEDVKDYFIRNCKFLVFDDSNFQYYVLQNGKRTPVDDVQKADFATQIDTKEQVFGEIPLRDGKRSAYYGKDGRLRLHDGTIMYPVLLRRYHDSLQFIAEYDGKFYQCLYVL